MIFVFHLALGLKGEISWVYNSVSFCSVICLSMLNVYVACLKIDLTLFNL